MHESGQSTIVAAFDIGSNSIKMTVAAVNSDGTVQEAFSASKTVRLGAGIDRTGILADDRMAAAFETLTDMVSRAREHGATSMIGVATEAVRVALNGRHFLDRVEEQTGISIALITGDDEAALAYAGLASLQTLAGATVMADIGGASTEVVAGEGESVIWSTSIPLGSGRLTDEFLKNDPPESGEVEACIAAARVLLSPLDLESARGSHLIVAGGTGEYLGRLVRDINDISTTEIAGVLDHLTRITSNELASQIDIAPLRARVLPAGIAIVSALAERIEPKRIAGGPSGLRAGMLKAAAKGSTT